MGEMLLLYGLFTIGIVVRFISTGMFSWLELGLISLLLLAALGGALLDNWQIRRDMRYGGRANTLATRCVERTTRRPKYVLEGARQIGSYRRSYQKGWQFLFVQLSAKLRGWFLNLNFSFAGRDVVYIEQRSSLLARNQKWLVYENGEVVGTVRTNASLKQMSTFKEVMLLTYQGVEYEVTSSTLSSKIEVRQGTEVIATSKANLRSDVTFKVNEQQNRSLILSVLVLFHYHFQS
ncbi:hypothetical protein [Exiguobacterium sp. s193]|uniref:tubby C-terminal domain-like protein n=1 Tax=Exiguobacterium sp. s193 TaxID=2751207 RepID=UPI001BEA570E|nr:hypothetical protein [Exiguobacterium sp. s193]